MRTSTVKDYFNPPHGGRPPSDEAVKKATERYKREEAEGKLKDLPEVRTTHRQHPEEGDREVKVYNIDYLASGEAVQITSLKGYNSDDEANNAQLGEGHARLQAKGANDIASLSEPLQAALWAFKAKKDEGMPADNLPQAIWDKLNPPPKKKEKPLQSSSDDGNKNSENGNGAGKKEKKMAKAKKAASKKKVAPKAKKSATGPRGEKTLKVKKLLERASGCTSAEVLEATGWPAVSMPAMAAACGLKLRIEKVEGKPKRYFGS